MSMLPIKKKVYNDGRTKQAFKDETDINRIMQRAQATGTLSHLAKYQPQYGDFGNFDFFEAQLNLTRGREIFDALPAEIRREFNQSPGDFFKFVNDPANADNLHKVLPGLAKPGRQNLDVSGKTPPQTPQGVAREPLATENQNPGSPPETSQTPAPAVSNEG